MSFKSFAYSLSSVSAVSVVTCYSVACLPVLSMVIHSPFSLTSAVPSQKLLASSYLQGIISSTSLLTKPQPSLDFTLANPPEKTSTSSYLQGVIPSPSLLIKPQPSSDFTIANPSQKFLASSYLQGIILHRLY